MALLFAAVLFQEEIRRAQTYGYLGVFIIGILCGVTIIPTPTLWLIFVFGHVLNPVWVGLVAGFGAAIGGITVYLTGAGMFNLLSRLRPRKQNPEHQPDISGVSKPVRSKSWFKNQTFYRRLMEWVGGKGGSWVVFISSAIISPFYYFTGLAAGTLRMGLLRFFLLSWAGKTVRYLIVAFAGYWGLSILLRWIGV
ncbi:MAG: VTT domain-containing protein [Chloroflexi bacterium]|nr:VTT domain-containing protein [Chloroflexota bacterium]